MANKPLRCVILADRHHGLTEGVRGLLETMFGTVIMVADEASLLESASRLEPAAVIADLSLARADNLGWLRQLRICCPKTKLIVLSVHDEPSVCSRTIEAGADGYILKRANCHRLVAGTGRRDGREAIRLTGGAPTKPELTPETHTLILRFKS